jgi:hypothetical protein
MVLAKDTRCGSYCFNDVAGMLAPVLINSGSSIILVTLSHYFHVHKIVFNWYCLYDFGKVVVWNGNSSKLALLIYLFYRFMY